MKIEDTIKEYTIYTDSIIYLKDNEIINTGNSRGIDQDGQTITTKNLNTIIKNILKANGDVKIEDTIKE